MRKLAFLLVVLGACGGGPVGNTSPGAWNDAVDRYIQAACTELSTCNQANPDTCASDARNMLGAVKQQLDATGQADCIDCLDAWATYDHDFSVTCDMADADKAPVTAACGAANETCKGFPPAP